MDGKHKYKIVRKPISLLLVEGDTDEIFYNRIKSIHLRNTRSTIKNIDGLYNINSKVISCISTYSQTHRDEIIRVYCCFDRESRYGSVPEFDILEVKKFVICNQIISVLNIDLIIATKQIESWFFYDIEGIYKFLAVPQSQRNLHSFLTLRNLVTKRSKDYSRDMVERIAKAKGPKV